MNDYEQRRLENWRRHNILATEIKKYIKYLKGNLERDKQRLENMQAYVAEHYVGFNEWIDQRIEKAKGDVLYWENSIAFEEWLLEQPQYIMTLPDSAP